MVSEGKGKMGSSRKKADLVRKMGVLAPCELDIIRNRVTDAGTAEANTRSRARINSLLAGRAVSKGLPEGTTLWEEMMDIMIAGIIQRGCRPDEMGMLMKMKGDMEEQPTQLSISLIDASLSARAVKISGGDDSGDKGR